MHSVHAFPSSCTFVANVTLFSSLNLVLLIGILEVNCVVSFEMSNEIASGWITMLKQRSLIKIETSCRHMLKKIYELLQEMYSDATSDYSTVSHWSQRLCQGQDCTQDKYFSGWPKISTDSASAAIITTTLEEDVWCDKDNCGIWNTKIIPSPCFNWDVRKKKVCCPLHENARPRITQTIRTFFFLFLLQVGGTASSHL